MRKLLLAWFFLLPLACHSAVPKVPPPAELKTLARDSLLQFNDAVQAKDFTTFHKKISNLWREQITPDQLLKAFGSFIEQNMNIASIATVDPVFEPAPAIDSDGVLTVQGYYATKPNKVTFRLKYYNESGAWKLIGVKLDASPSGSADVKLPQEGEIKTLVRDSLLAFNDAVQEKSFARFYKQIATVWQGQTSPEKLEKLFESFIEQEVNIAPLAKLEPDFDKPPAIDSDGVLRLEGSYATTPSAVRFNLGYIFEAPDWRLIKINVKVGKPPEE
ncbi:MAG: hypothetical protein ACJ8KX_10575 [Chthoniobacterales bacterium]